MSNNNKSSSSGLGFFGLLAIVFITLKLTHVISWSWWWVLSPIWIPFPVFALIFGVAIFMIWLGNR